MYLLQQFYFSNKLSHCKYYHNYFEVMYKLKNTVSCAVMKPTEKKLITKQKRHTNTMFLKLTFVFLFYPYLLHTYTNVNFNLNLNY